MPLANFSIYCTWKNIKSALTWNNEFDLPDGAYSISGFQNYFKYIIKNMKL